MPFLLVLNLIVPYVMILVGSILKKHPVSDMKLQNGYNTPTSRKSQAHWDYAQSIAPNIFIALGKILGVIEIMISILMFLFHISSQAAVSVGECVGIGFLLYGFYKTDSEIEKKFRESENSVCREAVERDKSEFL
ncbi:hypothetical protein IMSAGC018_00349 [Lachnospiraceae bacterium]|nr:hypothetical protein IMSAGC018_00349 [Lachnospiraceae bacterium]